MNPALGRVLFSAEAIGFTFSTCHWKIKGPPENIKTLVSEGVPLFSHNRWQKVEGRHLIAVFVLSFCFCLLKDLLLFSGSQGSGNDHVGRVGLVWWVQCGSGLI